MTIEFQFDIISVRGALSEWSIVPAWKASVLKGTAGSNPVRSAIFLFITFLAQDLLAEGASSRHSSGEPAFAVGSKPTRKSQQVCDLDVRV